MKFNLTVMLTLLIATVFAQSQKRIEVLTLGSFHFAFHNLDLIKTSTEDQIDVLETKYQKEIEDIASRIARFKPTIIVIERNPAEQVKSDLDVLIDVTPSAKFSIVSLVGVEHMIAQRQAAKK